MCAKHGQDRDEVLGGGGIATKVGSRRMVHGGKIKGQQDGDFGAHACYCASSGVGIEPFVIVSLEGLEECVPGRGEEQCVVRWWYGEGEMDGHRGVIRSVYEEGLESGQGREAHRHVDAGHPVVQDSLKDRPSSWFLLSPSITHVCPLRSPICSRALPRVRPGDRPVHPCSLARSSDWPREHPHNHDQAGQC